MFPVLLALLLSPVVPAADLALDALATDAARLARIEARVEQYRQGLVNPPVPPELLGMVEMASGLGGHVYRLDAAALKASAALARMGAADDSRLQGWLCVDAGQDVHVIFVGVTAEPPHSLGGLYHAVVSLDSGTVRWGDFAAPSDQRPLRADAGPAPVELHPLGDDLLREWQAREAVLQAHPSAEGAVVDPVVVQVEDSSLVFLLARSADPAVIQLGGHAAYMARFTGTQVGLKPFAVSREIVTIPRVALEPDAGSEQAFHGLFRSTDEVPVPRELHVYESLVYELPFFLTAQDHLWHVQGVTVRYLGKVE